ncbi:MAG: hypothetical protein H6561_11390 [Lewinellaceae bacterium]|nr:hypothetical protein [Lewinellaceae bacterium]
MKQLIVFIVCFFIYSFSVLDRKRSMFRIPYRLLVDNAQLKVTEYISTPGKKVCGAGFHHHDPHLVIVLTDASVSLTVEGGQTQNISVKAGTTLWSEAETHMVINNSEKPVKMLLVDVKSD